MSKLTKEEMVLQDLIRKDCILTNANCITHTPYIRHCDKITSKEIMKLCKKAGKTQQKRGK